VVLRTILKKLNNYATVVFLDIFIIMRVEIIQRHVALFGISTIYLKATGGYASHIIHKLI